MTGGAFLIIPLPHRQSDGRWLRRQLLRVRNSYGEREHQRQNGYPDHDPPFPGIRPIERRGILSHIFRRFRTSKRVSALAHCEFPKGRDKFANA
jgi:hypothetical protein